MTKTELLKVIRLHCLDCCCGSYDEVEHCGCPTCNLYPLRFGKDPTPRVLSPAQLAQIQNARARAEEKKQKSNAMGVSEDGS